MVGEVVVAAVDLSVGGEEGEGAAAEVDGAVEGGVVEELVGGEADIEQHRVIVIARSKVLMSTHTKAKRGSRLILSMYSYDTLRNMLDV